MTPKFHGCSIIAAFSYTQHVLCKGLCVCVCVVSQRYVCVHLKGRILLGFLATQLLG